MIADERGFLPKVRSITVDTCISAHAAEAAPVFKAVDAAVPRADLA